MPHGKGENHELTIVYHANESVIADSVPPLSGSICGEAFPVTARIFTVHKVFIDPCSDHSLRVFVKLLKLLIKPWCCFNAELHESISFHSSEIGLLFFPFFRYSE